MVDNVIRLHFLQHTLIQSTVMSLHSILLVCIGVIIVLHYGVIELRNAGSTDATLAVRKACMQNSRLCREDVSTSCSQTRGNMLVLGYCYHTQFYIYRWQSIMREFTADCTLQIQHGCLSMQLPQY